MSLQLKVRSEAWADLADAEDWYEKQRAGLGGELSREVMRVIREVQARPASFSIYRQPDVRRALCSQFPYAVYFRINGALVIVLAVLHLRRDHSRVLRRRR
jgi:plasmid stabilization system protein ParE